MPAIFKVFKNVRKGGFIFLTFSKVILPAWSFTMRKNGRSLFWKWDLFSERFILLFFFLVILLSGFWGWRWTKRRGLHNLKTKQMNRNNQTTTVRVDPACLILLCGSNLGGKSHNFKNPFLQKCVTLSVKMSGFLQQQIFCKVLIVKLLMVILPELRNLCSNPVHHLWK